MSFNNETFTLEKEWFVSNIKSVNFAYIFNIWIRKVVGWQKIKKKYLLIFRMVSREASCRVALSP